MPYDYDRTASALDTLAKAAQQRNVVLGKTTHELDRLEKRGVNFDARDRVKLNAFCERIQKLGAMAEAAAKRLFALKASNENSELVLELTEHHLREWRVASTDLAVTQYKDKGGAPIVVFKGKAAAAAAGQLNIDIIDFANAIKFNDPDMLSVRDSEFRQFV